MSFEDENVLVLELKHLDHILINRDDTIKPLSSDSAPTPFSPFHFMRVEVGV